MVREVQAGLFAFCCVALAATAGAPAADPDPETVVFAGSAHYPPYEWRDEAGTARGFLIDLEDAIAASGGRSARHMLGSWPDALAALESGSADAVPMFASKARARRYSFTDPFYYATHAIFGPPGYPGLAGPAALAGARVAVVEGGYADAVLKRRFPAVQLVARRDIAAALQAVVDGAAAFALESRPVAARMIATLDLSLAQLSRPLWPRAYVFAVRRDRPEFLAWLQAHLVRVQASGRYHDIYDAWEHELEWHRSTWTDALAYMAWVAVPLLLLVALALVWNRSLRRRVAGKTQSLEQELRRRQAAEAALHRSATREQLTGLPNRAEFGRLADEMLRHDAAPPDRMVAIRLMDLDEVVSAFGHKAGEQVIRQFAAHLAARHFPAVGDFGRGYFGILLAGLDNLDDLQALLAQPAAFDGMEIEPHVVAGAAHLDNGATDADELLRRAETALSASAATRTRLTHYTETLEPDPDDLLIVQDFRRFGLAGIEPHFQPQYDARSRHMVAVEALARWTHATMGPIGPGRFIPLLERAGLAPEVTAYMLDAAIRMGKALREAGRPLRVNVNISATDLLEGDLPATIRERLRALGGEARDLGVEVTETSLIADPVRASKIFEDLQAAGVACAIDDFGTGYSSLTYLSRFSLGEIKIDRSFVFDMTENARHRAIVQWTVQLAHELGLRVVAEGPEDENTLRALLAAGCDYAQGYVFARPMPAAQLMALHAAG